MKSSLKSLLHKPPTLGAIFIPFLVYFGTYATANLFDSFYACKTYDDPNTISTATSKFLATTAVSTGLCVYKDGYFAAMASRGPAPLLSYFLFTARDVVTVWASFNLPTMIAPKLADFPFASLTPFQSIFSSDESRLKMAQMLMPAASQLVSTPLHLLGLDLSHRPYRLPIRERVSAVRRHLAFATPLRMMRIIPPFGFGSVVNTGCRRSMMAQVM